MEGAALPAESDHFRLLGLLVGASHVGRFAHRIFGFEGRTQSPSYHRQRASQPS
jgi:hypothetical protein